MKSHCIFHLTLFTLIISLGCGAPSWGQCHALEFSEDESAFLSGVMAPNGANQAFWNDDDAGRLHCYFGLDTIVWREGRLDSIYWGRALELPVIGGSQLCGVYQGAVTWLYRGQLHLLGKASAYSSVLDLLACNPSTGWERLAVAGEMPSIHSALRGARVDGTTMLFFGDDGLLMTLNLSTLTWAKSGKLTDKIVDYLGEFSVVDLSDYIMLFGNLGGGLIQKSTMEFVTNYDLRIGLVASAHSISVNLNQLSIHTDSPDFGASPVVFDAVSMFSGGASMSFQDDVEENAPATFDETVGVGFLIFGAGLGLGSLLVWLLFRRGRPAERNAPDALEAAPTPRFKFSEEVPISKRNESLEGQFAVQRKDEGKGPAGSGASEVEVLEAPSVLSEERTSGRAMGSEYAVVNRSKKRSGLEDLMFKFQSSEVQTFNAAELNVMLGIELDASEESQRARRARLVKQLNEMSVEQTGHKVIVRERDPNDRRHLLYRINK